MSKQCATHAGLHPSERRREFSMGFSIAQFYQEGFGISNKSGSHGRIMQSLSVSVVAVPNANTPRKATAHVQATGIVWVAFACDKNAF